MAEHTPGPWIVGDKPGVWVGPVVKADGGNKGVAFVCGSHPVNEANARLIAAAPELLAAANELLANATEFGFVGEDYSALPVIHEAVVKLSRACRKAEGRAE